jgi:hypothetical protein
MLLVIHGMVSFAILYHLLTIHDLEEKIVVSLKEMNKAKTSEIGLALFLFVQQSERMGPSVQSKPMWCDREVDHINK